MQQVLSKIAIFLSTLALFSLFFPYGVVVSIDTEHSMSPEIRNGYALIYPIFSVILLIVVSYLLYSPKRKRDLSLSLILCLSNLMIIGVIYQQLKLGAALYSETFSSQIGYYFLQYTSIGIGIISILRIINLKAFLTAKREYEEIITEEYQKLP